MTKRRPKKAEHYREKHTMFSSPGQIVPSEALTTLTYPYAGRITAAGLQYISQRWTTNDAYDVDPIFGSTNTVGFNEWAAFYNYYRVVSYSTIFEFTNEEAFTLGLYVVNNTQDPGTTGANFYAKAASPLGRSYQLPPVGTTGSHIKVRISHTIAEVVGSKAPETDDNFRALTNASPADKTWIGVGIDTHSASNLLTAKGVPYRISHRLVVRFYGRKELTN